MKRFPRIAIALAATSLTVLAPAPAFAGFVETGRSEVLYENGVRIIVFEGSPPPGTSNATNNVRKGIRIYERPHRDPFAAVAAQELFEFGFKRSFGASMMAKRHMELVSHEVESLVAARFYGRNLAEYEETEATAMVSYTHLRGMAVPEIVAAMRAARPAAEHWLAQNSDIIRKLVAYRSPFGAIR